MAVPVAATWRQLRLAVDPLMGVSHKAYFNLPSYSLSLESKALSPEPSNLNPEKLKDT